MQPEGLVLTSGSKFSSFDPSLVQTLWEESTVGARVWFGWMRSMQLYFLVAVDEDIKWSAPRLIVSIDTPLLKNKVQCDLSLSLTTPRSIALEEVCGEFIKGSYISLRLNELGEVMFHYNRVICRVSQRGTQPWVWSFYDKKILLRVSLACCTSGPVLKVEWKFWDFLFPLLKFEIILD